MLQRAVELDEIYGRVSNVHYVHHLLIKQQEDKAHMVIQTEKMSINYHQKTQNQIQYKRQTRKSNEDQ
jgi:hypothetical protein